MNPISIIGKTVSEETSGKKRARKRTKWPTKVRVVAEILPLHEDIDPKILADLAIKIIHLKGGNGSAAERQPVRFDNAGLHDSLDDAKRLLLAAKGVLDEDVHAYRLFSEDDDLMSFEGIAKRFTRVKWHKATSRNTVELIIETLVSAAELEVQKEREKYEEFVSVRLRYPGGVYSLADRAREQVRAMIGDLELEVLFSNPDKVADAMGQFFLHLMGKDITGDWERHLDEEFASVAGFTSFIEYVCGGMTYEQFIPKGPDVRMDPERLACLKFFLESVDVWQTFDYKAKAKDLGTLMRFIRGPGKAPASLAGHLESFLKELRKMPAKEESVKQVAKAAHDELKKFCDRIYLAKVVGVQDWHSLTLMLEIFSKDTSESYPIEKIKVLHNLLQQTKVSVQNLNFEPTEIRAKLNEISDNLAEASNLLKAAEASVLAEEMDKVAKGLDRGLRMEANLPMDLERALEKLLIDLRPLKGARRKCRPYELFLFAAQKRLCREDLIRKRSSLVTGVVTGPPYSGSLSILLCHKGASVAMGIEDPG
jgi:hypothetical protein